MRVITKKAAVDIIRLKAGLQQEEIRQTECVYNFNLMDVSIKTSQKFIRGIVDASNAKILYCGEVMIA